MDTTPERQRLPGMQGRFNVFQRTMLQWNRMHPYNAVHVVRIPGAPDQERLRKAIERILQAVALTGLTIYPDGTYRYTGGPAKCELRDLAEPADGRVLLTAEIERQLNTPFDLTPPFSPFRFFVLRSGASFRVGLVYLHAVADAESIVLLLKKIIENYSGCEPTQHSVALGRAPAQGNLQMSRFRAGAWKLTSFPRLIRDLRRSCRPRYQDPADRHNGAAVLVVETPRLLAVVKTAKSWGITVNDLLLAVLMRSCAAVAPERKQAQRRTHVSVGCIVNIRRELIGESRAGFGLFLGSFVLTHRVPEEMTLKELAQDIGRRTVAIKRKKLYLATPLELSLGRLLLSIFPEEHRNKLYQKHYPLWGGLTNMNVNLLWPAPKAQESADYLRAVSTGPATPLVLSFTTSREGANIGLTYRSTVFRKADIDRFVGCFQDNLEHLEGGR